MLHLGAQKNFAIFMQDLRSRRGGWVPDEAWYRELIAKAILYQLAERTVRQEQFAAYRANVVAYVTAAVVHRSGSQLDLDRVWRTQTLSDELIGLLRVWSHEVNQAIVDSARGRNVTEWCKKEGCWEAVRALDLPLPATLPPELAGRLASAPGNATTVDGSVTAEDLENIAICKRIDGETWLRISAWGKKTGLLKGWEASIAHTLSGYAAHGWERSPSPKQARHGARTIRIAEQDGLLVSGSGEAFIRGADG